jgi:hypothetical protein
MPIHEPKPATRIEANLADAGYPPLVHRLNTERPGSEAERARKSFELMEITALAQPPNAIFRSSPSCQRKALLLAYTLAMVDVVCATLALKILRRRSQC